MIAVRALEVLNFVMHGLCVSFEVSQLGSRVITLLALVIPLPVMHTLNVSLQCLGAACAVAAAGALQILHFVVDMFYVELHCA